MSRSDPDFTAANVSGAYGSAQVLLLCEHASNVFPSYFGDLGLTESLRCSHVAWDPGAYDVADQLSQRFAAPLVSGGVSRLLYDCNRPPDEPSAIPEKSEVVEIPGNQNLSPEDKAERIELIYQPFCQAVAGAIVRAAPKALVTIHSFTPIYHGTRRDQDLGVLHDSDSRLADALLDSASNFPFRLSRNEPYGPEDGVTHSLKIHGVEHGLLNVMIEIRNDLIATAKERANMAHRLGELLEGALERCGVGLSPPKEGGPVGA